jgi:hypothetical protein
MELGTMADLADGIRPEKRSRIDAIKDQMVDAERGHELASPARPSVRKPGRPW